MWRDEKGCGGASGWDEMYWDEMCWDDLKQYGQRGAREGMHEKGCMERWQGT